MLSSPEIAHHVGLGELTEYTSSEAWEDGAGDPAATRAPAFLPS
jgi:hypothetical protein